MWGEIYIVESQPATLLYTEPIFSRKIAYYIKTGNTGANCTSEDLNLLIYFFSMINL